MILSQTPRHSTASNTLCESETGAGFSVLSIGRQNNCDNIEHVITGDTVTDVLKYVGYSRDELTARLRRSVEHALRNRRMTLEESRNLLRIYESGLSGYTYLERD